MVLEELNALQARIEARHATLEAEWVTAHQKARAKIDAIGASFVVFPDGLMSFLTRGADAKFEAAVESLWDEFYAEAAMIEKKYE